MLPLEDQPELAEGRVERRRLVPFVTYLLVALNVLVFVYQLTLSPRALNGFVATWGAVPSEILSGDPVALVTLLTSMFVHGGLVHIFANMVFLWVFGDNVEEALGHLTFLGFYLLAGIVAGLSQVFVFPASSTPMIGASGAVAGVLAGYLLLFPRAPVRILLFLGPFFVLGRVAALVLIGLWILLQFVQGFLSLGLAMGDTGGVAYFAHIGGFLAGAVLTGVIRAARGERLGSFAGGFLWGRVFRNWLLLIVGLLIVLGVGALVGTTSPALGTLIQAFGVFLAAVVAVVDGMIRMSGRPSLLGGGMGTGRVIAIFQVLAGLGLLVGALA